ncbi:hypothetical protein PIB30_014105 [Stylosanthes scabra]|uniref:Uncharacterized protein n=1 Tax=Stylosanthes scabra TaxID=79078 RepID=A0ABU6S800_9FABA|nr:hypothetical protein [Stylosanthes scabra]
MEKENESVRGRRDAFDLFAMEIDVFVLCLVWGIRWIERLGLINGKEDRLWVDKRSEDDAFIAELKRLQEERQAIIDAGGPEPPPIDEDEVLTRIAGGRKRGMVYGMGVEISQQTEAHAQRVAAVEAVYAEKVRTLKSTVQTQSQEVSELRKVYSDMYSFVTQMRSSGSSATAMPDMPPPPPLPPLARSQSPPPQHDQGTGSPSIRMTPTMSKTFIILFICIYILE